MHPVVPRVAFFALACGWAGFAHGDVTTTINSNGTTSNTNPDAETFFVKLGKPEVPAARSLLMDTIQFSKQSGSGSTLTLKFWGVTNSSSPTPTVTQIGTNITINPSNTGGLVNHSLGLFVEEAYSISDYYVLEIDNAIGKWQSTTNNSFTISQPTVISSAGFVTSSNGKTAYSGTNYVWMNITATATNAPEPGTLALGTLAALSGAGGWWVRRKKKTNALATAETGSATGSETPPSAV